MSRLVPPAIVALLGLSLSGCATTRAPAPAIAYDDFPKPAQLIDEPPPPVEIVETPTSLPLPGQMKPVDLSAAPEPGDPPARIAEANAAARMEPGERILSAARRVDQALTAVGPRLRPIVSRICVHGDSLKLAETGLGLRRRQGKTLLKQGLQALAEHYGIGR